MNDRYVKTTPFDEARMADLEDIIRSIREGEWGNVVSPKTVGVLAAGLLAAADFGLLWLVSATWVG